MLVSGLVVSEDADLVGGRGAVEHHECDRGLVLGGDVLHRVEDRRAALIGQLEILLTDVLQIEQESICADAPQELLVVHAEDVEIDTRVGDHLLHRWSGGVGLGVAQDRLYT